MYTCLQLFICWQAATGMIVVIVACHGIAIVIVTAFATILLVLRLHTEENELELDVDSIVK